MDDLTRQAHAIFRAALDLETAERPAYVATACGDGVALRREVDGLMAALGEQDGFLGTPALIAIDQAEMEQSDRERLGRRLGRYHVESVIGTGGMGVVYRAQQENPRRTVALKVMRTGFATPTAMRRFQMETETLARLRHPGIAQIFEAGTDRQGAIDVPWIALEHVEGARDILSAASERHLDVRGRVAIFLQVCDAVHHANLRGVVHRDLKPANILVDQTGQAKVIDFGVSQLTDPDATSVSMLTAAGHLVGTLPWMSPEQCIPGQGDLDLRCDVYALGVILYELLTGRRPYAIDELPIHEATRVICEQPPTRPGTIDENLSGDLETIMLTALEKDRERRYGSVDDLASDLRRTLAREPIEARPATRSYRLRLFLLRHRTLALATALIFLTLLTTTLLATWFAFRVARERDQSLWQAYLGSIAAAQASVDAGELAYLEAKLDAAPERFRGWEWNYLARSVGDRDRILTRHETMIAGAAFTADAGLAASGDVDGEVRITDTVAERVTATWQAGVRVRDLAFCANDTLVAAALQNGKFEVRPLDGRSVRASITVADAPLRTLARTPDDTRIVVGDDNGDVTIVKIADWTIEHQFHAHDSFVMRAIFSDDGSLLVTGGDEHLVRIWRVDDWSPVRTLVGHQAEIRSLAFDPTMRFLATGSSDKTARLWELATGTEVARFETKAGPWALAFYSETVLAVGYLRAITLWDYQNDDVVMDLRGHSERPRAMAFTPDKSALVTASWDQTVRRWDLRPAPTDHGIAAHDEVIHDMCFDPRGHRVYSAARDGSVRIFDAWVGDHLASFPIVQPDVWQRAINVSPDGLTLAVGDDNGTVSLFATDTTELIATWKAHDDWVTRVVYSPDGQLLATASADGVARIFTAAGTPVASLTAHEDTVRAIAFSPDGEIFATGSWDDRVMLWRTSDWSLITTLEDHAFDVYALDWSSDGELLASGSRDRVIIVWDREGNVVARRDGHGQFITDLAFHPSEPRLASGAWFGPIRLWDAVEMESLLPLHQFEGQIRAIDWSKDGAVLASAGSEGVIRLWDATRGKTVRDRTETALTRRAALRDRIDRADDDGDLTASERLTLSNLRLFSSGQARP